MTKSAQSATARKPATIDVAGAEPGVVVIEVDDGKTRHRFTMRAAVAHDFGSKVLAAARDASRAGRG
jgi:hypothetical protein